MGCLLPIFLFLLPFSPFPASAFVPPPEGSSSSDGVVGVIYAMNTPDLLPPIFVADALVTNGVPRVLLIDPYPEGVAAFSQTGVSIVIAVNNTYLPALAANETAAVGWVVDNILASNVTVEGISVGYSVLTDNLDLADYILPALKNLHAALSKVGINIPVSTAHNYDLLATGFPPSQAEFNKSVATTYLKPLLAFLNETKSAFLTNAFPFKLYRSDAVQMSDSKFATFEANEGSFVMDTSTGLIYTNLFEAMVDAVVSAMHKLGYDDIPVVVSGTGWPSAGGSNEPEANILFAAEYNERLVVKQNMRPGTPMRPDQTPLTYIYSLFDDPRNGGDELERNWGIWTSSMDQKYEINFTPLDSSSDQQRPPARWLFSAGGIVALVLFWLF